MMNPAIIAQVNSILPFLGSKELLEKITHYCVGSNRLCALTWMTTATSSMGQPILWKCLNAPIWGKLVFFTLYEGNTAELTPLTEEELCYIKGVCAL